MKPGASWQFPDSPKALCTLLYMFLLFTFGFFNFSFLQLWQILAAGKLGLQSRSWCRAWLPEPGAVRSKVAQNFKPQRVQLHVSKTQRSALSVTLARVFSLSYALYMAVSLLYWPPKQDAGLRVPDWRFSILSYWRMTLVSLPSTEDILSFNRSKPHHPYWLNFEESSRKLRLSIFISMFRSTENWSLFTLVNERKL